MLLPKLLVFYGYLCSWLLGFSVAWDDNSALITAPTNKTVYVGHAANFYSETHSSCNIRTYVNGHICTTTTNGQSVSNTVGNITYSNCSIYNTQLSDDGTRIVVRVYCNKITSFGPVFLRVIGPPSSPLNLTIDQSCNMIVIIAPALYDDTIEVYIEIMRENDTTFNITKSAFPVNISASVFEDRSERYKIILYNKNPAGLSQPYEMDLLFKTNFDIISSFLQIINNKVMMTITIQVNMSCLLSLPRQLNLSSNCLNNNFYQVINGTTIDESGLIDLSVILHPNKMNCNVTVSSGDYELYIINQNTYEVQEVIVPEDTSMGYFSINCTFLPGSQAKGCAIEVFNETTDLVFKQNIHRLLPTSSYAVDNISLSINGTYTIYVYVWDKYGRVNKSFVVMTKVVRVTTMGYQGDNNDNTSVNSTSNTPNNDNGDIKHEVGTIVVVVVTVVTLLILVTIVITAVLIFKKRCSNKKDQYGCDKNCLKIQVKKVKVIDTANGVKQDYGRTKYDESIELVLVQGNQNQREIPIEEDEQRNDLEQDGRNKDIKKDNNNVTSIKSPDNNEVITNIPEQDTHDHYNNTLKRRSGTYKPEVLPASDLSVTGLTDDSITPLIKPVEDTKSHEQNIDISTYKPEHVTSTSDPSSTYPTDNYEAQRLNETADTKVMSDDTQEIEISTSTTIQPHIVQSTSSQPVQCPTSESATFPTDNSEIPLLNETAKENEILSTQPFVGQSSTSQPVRSLNSDSATFPTEGSEVPLLKPEDDTVDQFLYEDSYNVDETEATTIQLKTTVMVSSVVRQLSTISEKDEQVLPFENLPATSGEAVQPVGRDEAPYQMVYPPPTIKLHPPEQSTIVGTVPTTPTIPQEFIFPTNETK